MLLQNPAANAAAAGAAAAELVAAEEQAAAKAAAKKEKQRQKEKKSTSPPQLQQSLDIGQSTVSVLQSPESRALQSMGMSSGRQHGKVVDAALSPAASQAAARQTSATFLLNLFRCPLSKVPKGTPTTTPLLIVGRHVVKHSSKFVSVQQLCSSVSCYVEGLQVMMTDPMVAADGHTYERAAIAAWLEHHTTSPVTQQPLPHTRIFPNQAAKAAIANQHAL